MEKLLKYALMLTLICAVHGTHADAQKMAEMSQEHGEMNFQRNMPSVSGKVVETMDSGGYTYINIEKDNKKTWVAVPQTAVKVGQEMSFYPGAAMPNYKSNTLNRTFETIIFSSGPVTKNRSKTAENPHNGKSSISVAKEEVTVDKASGPNAYTVAELYDKRTTLDKKSVMVRGKVVKISANIMKKNWIHIQDGSGNPKDGSHDLILTSQDLPSVGDIVTASGTLMNNKDIGRGYKFDIILEQAEIKK